MLSVESRGGGGGGPLFFYEANNWFKAHYTMTVDMYWY